MTQTVRFEANTSWQVAASGAKTLQINPEMGYSLIAVTSSNSAPSSDTDNTFLLKPVAGENYLSFALEAGDYLHIKSKKETSILSWIEHA